MKEKIESYSDAWKINPEIEKLVKAPSGLVKILNPSMVLDMFSRIPDEDIQYLLMNPAHSHPKDMVLSRIPVPPVCTRPSVVSELKAETNEDDLTMKYNDLP